VPFTLRTLKKDLEDVVARFDGPPDLEFRLATEALELEQIRPRLQGVSRPAIGRLPRPHDVRRR